MKKLKELREAKNLTQNELAKLLNIKQQTLSCYENETREADYNTLLKIAQYFDVTIDYLLDARTEDLIIMTREQYTKTIA